MAFELRSYRRQYVNGMVVPDLTGGFASAEEASSAARRALATREELQYAEIVDESTGAVVETVKR